jgi:hypothetical protein
MKKDDGESSISTHSSDEEVVADVPRPKKPKPNLFTSLYFTYLDPLIRCALRLRAKHVSLCTHAAPPDAHLPANQLTRPRCQVWLPQAAGGGGSVYRTGG